MSGSPSVNGEAPVEIDLKNPHHKTVHDAIIKSIYNQQEVAYGRSELTTNAKVLVDFETDIRGRFADAEIMSIYNTRMTRALNLGNPPIGGNKLQKWRADLARAIEGQNDPSKWNLKAQKAVKLQIGTNAAKAQQILRDAAKDAETQTIKIGLIEILEKKKIELAAAKKKLETRLKDEKEYTKAQHDVQRLLVDIATKDEEISTAETNMDSHGINHQKTDKSGNRSLDTAALQVDPVFKKDKKIYNQRVIEKATLQEELRTAKETMRTIGSKYSNVDRGLVVDTSGKLTNSTTLEKLNSTTGANIGVKEKIRLADVEIARLTSEVDVRLTTTSELFGKVVRAAVKK